MAPRRKKTSAVMGKAKIPMRKEERPKKRTKERKSSPLVRQKETPAEATAHRVPRREIDDDTTTSDSEEGEVEVLATAKKSFKDDLDASSSEGGNKVAQMSQLRILTR